MLRRLLAVALAAACLSTPAWAADPPFAPSLPFLGQGGTIYNECRLSDGTRLFSCNVLFGWTGTAFKPLSADASGYLGVNVFSLPLATGAATSAKQDALLTALGTPLQSGGPVSQAGVAWAASGKTPVTATLSSAGATGSFTPLAGRPFNVEITGTWTGTIRLMCKLPGSAAFVERKETGGTSIYAWTGNTSEVIDADPETGAIYELSADTGFSGSASVRMSH